jgi:hypothetical protein
MWHMVDAQKMLSIVNRYFLINLTAVICMKVGLSLGNEFFR